MLDQDFYHQTKTTIGFWYRRGLNPRSLIQPLETLPVELTRTHPYFLNILRYNKNDLTSGCFANTSFIYEIELMIDFLSFSCLLTYGW